MSAPTELTMIALEPVWVPYAPNAVREVKKGWASNPGPNGESPDTGSWELLLPDGTIHTGPKISASALETASECIHKWALSRLDGHEKPENRKAELGGLRHAELEDWIKHANRPTTEGMAKVIEHFPMPGQMESEKYFGMLFGRPGHEVVFAGYLDGRESRVPVSDDDYSASERMNSVIRDLKTTGDFRWKKTPAQLRANIQACLYGLGEMLRVDEWSYVLSDTWPDTSGLDRCDAVVLKWTYAQLKENKEGIGIINRVETVCECSECKKHGEATKDPEHARTGGVLLHKEDAVRTVLQYLPLAEQLIEAIQAEKTAADMDKNFEACAAYGGCPWKKIEVCETPEGGGFKARMRQKRLKAGIDVGTSRVLLAIGDGSSSTTDTKKKRDDNMAIINNKKNIPAATVAAKTMTVAAKTTTVAAKTTTVAAKPTPAPAPATGLASRFGPKPAAAVKPAPAAAPKTQTATVTVKPSRFAKPAQVEPHEPAQEPDEVTPAPVTAKPATGTSRFAERTVEPVEVEVEASTEAEADGMASDSESAEDSESTVVDTVVEADGMASDSESAEDSESTVVDTVVEASLRQRLQQMGKKSAAAVVDKAPKHAVGDSVLAVGINPPDAAPEWTAEQQAEESARIAKKFGSVESGSAEVLEPEAVAAPTTDATTDAAASEPKRGRGRPKASNAAAPAQPVATAHAQSAPAFEPHGAIDANQARVVLDSLALRLVSSGYRKAAAEVMFLAANISQG